MWFFYTQFWIVNLYLAILILYYWNSEFMWDKKGQLPFFNPVGKISFHFHDIVNKTYFFTTEFKCLMFQCLNIDIFTIFEVWVHIWQFRHVFFSICSLHLSILCVLISIFGHCTSDAGKVLGSKCCMVSSSLSSQSYGCNLYFNELLRLLKCLKVHFHWVGTT